MSSTPPPNGPEYPSYPGAGDGWVGAPYDGRAPAPAAGVPQPAAVRTAVWLMWLGAAVGLVSLVVSMATLDSARSTIEERLRQDDPGVSQSYIDTMVTIGVASAVCGALLGAAAWAWMAWKNGQGRSWARVVATVFGGINVLSTLGGFALGGGANTYGTVVALVVLAMTVVILVLLWRRDSSEFYAARSS
jgi:hypothetical protein